MSEFEEHIQPEPEPILHIEPEYVPRRLSYRLSDFLRHNNVKLPKDCLLQRYVKEKNKEIRIDYDCLYKIFLESDYKSCPPKSMVIHLRLFDWLWWPNGATVSMSEYDKFLEKNENLVKSLDNIFILYGCTNNDKKKESDKFVEDLIEKIKIINNNVRILSTNNTEQDFKYMITSEYFLPSMGGYSTLAGAINKNIVFWYFTNVYFHTYKAPFDKRDVHLFRNNYLENRNNKKAVVLLTRGYDKNVKYNTLCARNKEIEKNVQTDTDYIIYHEGNISLDQQTHISKQTPNISFLFVNVSDDFLKQEGDYRVIFNKNLAGPTASLGYRNMCSFWFCGFWKHVEKYDKILRIDEDILLKMNYLDIFNELEGKVAVSAVWMPDCAFVVEGLKNFTKEFLKTYDKHQIDFRPGGPYTNVFALDLNKIRENNIVKEYCNKIYESNNIYRRRWGDLPLWGEVLKNFFNEDDYKTITSIKYFHGSTKKGVNYRE